MTFKVNQQRCVKCGKCVKDCPTNTLEMKDGVESESLVPLADMPIPPPNEVANLIRSRRSIRQYVRENVPREDIDALLETLKYVPTGCNDMDLTVPEAADVFGIPHGAPFYAMLFGSPAVDYVRCVDRSAAAKIVYR